MAEVILDEDKKTGGGNRNAIAYGLLQGAGVNTTGLTPSQAWELVTQMNLMESKDWKRTDEDKKDIKEKNVQFKQSGGDLSSIEQRAKEYSKTTNFSGVGNKSALNDAVNSINDVMKAYGLSKLEVESVKNLSIGVMANANDSAVNISSRLVRNPNAAYRICVENYSQRLNEDIIAMQEKIEITNNPWERDKLNQRLESLKSKKDFKRHNVVYKGEEIKSVITHEMGHVLAGQIFGFVSQTGGNYGANKKIVECFNQSKQNGDIKKISAYASKDADEFFAECFTMYTMGKEKLPQNIESMMEGVLKKWKK